MKELFEPIASFFQELQPREKLFLIVGVAVVVMVVSVKLLFPIWQNHSQLMQQKDALEADLTWLQAQRDIVGKMTNSCPPQRLQQQSAREILTQLARRNQVQMDSLVDKDNKFLLNAEGEDGNRLLQFMYQSACYGFVVEKVKINRGDNSTRFGIVLEISRAG